MKKINAEKLTEGSFAWVSVKYPYGTHDNSEINAFVKVHDVIKDNWGSEDDLICMKVLIVDDEKKKYGSSNMEFGNFWNVHVREFEAYKIIDEEPLFDISREMLEKKDHEFDVLHKTTPFTIEGRVYSEEPIFSPTDIKKCYPRYEMTAVSVWNPKDVYSLEDAEKWLIQKHPDYYFGYSAWQDCPSGDFRVIPGPGQEYPEGRYETIENRRKYIEEKAIELGIQVGPWELNVEEEREME